MDFALVQPTVGCHAVMSSDGCGVPHLVRDDLGILPQIFCLSFLGIRGCRPDRRLPRRASIPVRFSVIEHRIRSRASSPGDPGEWTDTRTTEHGLLGTTTRPPSCSWLLFVPSRGDRSSWIEPQSLDTRSAIGLALRDSHWTCLSACGEMKPPDLARSSLPVR